MKKRICCILVCLLVLMFFTPLALNAEAAETSDVMTLNLSNNSKGLSAASSQTSGLPFTVVPQNVSGLYTTNRDNGYNFVPGRVSGNTISVNGTLIHSLSAGSCKGGVCHFSGGTAYSDIAGTAISEQLINVSASKATLNRDSTYYGFAKNMTGAGVISSGYIYIKSI